MKKLTDRIEQCILKAEQHWQLLPRPKQRIFTLALLLSYILATLLSTLSIWTVGQQSNKVIPKEHIKGISSGIKKKAIVLNVIKYRNNERSK